MSIPTGRPYLDAQIAVALLKGAILEQLRAAGPHGLTNADLGRSLGIYGGHVGHEGHIPRTLLALMQDEGVAYQHPESKRWSVRASQESDT